MLCCVSICSGLNIVQATSVGIAAAKATVEDVANVPSKFDLQRIAGIYQSSAKMQAAAALCAAPVLPPVPSKNLSKPTTFPSKLGGSSLSTRGSPIHAYSAPRDANTVDYTSSFSVFPAEACETIGGDACSAAMYPEANLSALQPIININIEQATEDMDREYLEYTAPKTVFPAEACDDLGGEFCERPYQRGVY
ncbi:hypothetical protein MLD38_013283 [Melastoma candidum]|uniref:Uncharacterized protein n=1 Tax=Melastoma candidum TaxID=119954 RepID=A0ACB9RC78_9MYRT|nr:hypothetical protein MLD38_013283 [Melastoma candidum]